jgi:hypothetical protein
MRLKKYSRFAIIMGATQFLLGASWLVFEEGDVLDDDAFPGMAMLVGGLSLLLYTFRTKNNLGLKEYHDTKSLDNELLFSDTGHVEIISNDGFTRVLGVLSALGIIISAGLAIFYLGWFLERPRMSRVNDPGEVIGMVLAPVTIVCVVQSAIYTLRTFDARWVRA